MSYKKLWKQIIRPPRTTYNDSDLGDLMFRLSGKRFHRTDLEFLSIRGEKIVASHFEPVEEERVSPILPCVVFLHGNAGCRLDSLNLTYVLTGNMTLFTFDFPGCGNSHGKYVSLGYHEQHDLGNIVEYLRHERRVGEIALWGRSMGAVTAILYCSTNPKAIQALVLDSPFSKFKDLAFHLAKANASFLPSFCISIAFKLIRRSIKKKIGADIKKLNPIKVISQFSIPTCFIYSYEDELIDPEQFVFLESCLKNLKKSIVLRGGHNDQRSTEVLGEVGTFLVEHLNIKKLIKEPIYVPYHLDCQGGTENFEQTSNEILIDSNNIDLYLTINAKKYYQTKPAYQE